MSFIIISVVFLGIAYFRSCYSSYGHMSVSSFDNRFTLNFPENIRLCFHVQYTITEKFRNTYRSIGNKVWEYFFWKEEKVWVVKLFIEINKYVNQIQWKISIVQKKYSKSIRTRYNKWNVYSSLEKEENTSWTFEWQ